VTTSTLQASVARWTAKGKAANPQLSTRYDRAAAIVLAGEYQTTSEPDTLLVRGYHVNGQCECPDYTLGNAPTVNGRRYCKHMIAKALVARLAEESEQTASDSPNAWQQSMAWQAFARSYSK